MATTVTVTNAYVNKGFYDKDGGGGSFSQQITIGGGGTSNMAWIGQTPNSLASYGGESSIVSQSNLLFNGAELYTASVGINIGGYSAGTRFRDLSREANGSLSHTQLVYSNTAGVGNRIIVYRSGGGVGSSAVAPSNAVIEKDTYYVNDQGTTFEAGAEVIIEVDGAISDGDFSTNMSWALKDGASAMSIMMSLYPNLFTVVPAVRLSNLVGTGTRMVVADVNGDLSTQDLTIVYPATTLNVVTSDGVTGDVDSVAVAADADILQVEEKTGVPGFDIQFAFAGVASFNNILLYSKYTGGAGHTVKLQLWNPALGSWMEVDEFTNETTFQLHNIPILNGSSYVDSDGEVELRLYHPAAGNATHYIEIDYVVLRNTNDFSGGGGVTHHSNLTGLADDDHTQYALLAGRGGETLVIDAINFTDSTTFIHMDSAGALIFEDAIGGPYELAELVGSMVYPGVGIALSTGSAWAASITNNSTNWNNAQAGHVNLTSLAALSYVSASFVKMTAAGTFALDTATYNNYVHPNHSGQVTSTADGATVVTVSAITAQTEGTVIADTDEFLYSDGGVIKRVDASIIKAYASDILKLISYTDCADNATTNVVIGTTADVTYIVHYIAERNMGTVQKQAGTLTVLYDDVTGAVTVFRSSVGPLLDFEITGDTNAGNIRLNIVVGDDNVNNLSFDSRIVSKLYE